MFLCSQNKKRSLTAEVLFRYLEEHQVRSAGTETNARIKVNEGMIRWADLIFVMEKKHRRRIVDKYGQVIAGKKVVCLNIPDDYEYMDRELIELLEAAMEDV